MISLKASEQSVLAVSCLAGLMGGVYLLLNSESRLLTLTYIMISLFNAAFLGIIGGAIVLYIVGENTILISAGAGISAVLGKDVMVLIKDFLIRKIGLEPKKEINQEAEKRNS